MRRSPTSSSSGCRAHRPGRDRRPRPGRPHPPAPAGDIDWDRTIAANLRHYQPEHRTVIPERLVGYGRRSTQVEREIILCIDQSGSMAASVVYTRVFGAVLASLRSVARGWSCSTPRSSTSPTSSTTRSTCSSACSSAAAPTSTGRSPTARAPITRPRDTVLVLISDLYEGGVPEEMLRRARSVVGAGVTVVALLALSDDGAPAYDPDHAAALAELGVPAFACTPDLFPDLMAAAIERRDIGEWAAANDIVTTHETTQPD